MTAFIPVDPELALGVTIFEPVDSHVEYLRRCAIMVLLTYLSAVDLSTWTGERGCFHPISSNALRSGTIYVAHL